MATPVVVLLGRQYVSGAIKSLRNGSANMDVLVAMGSLAAYVYGLIVLLGIDRWDSPTRSASPTTSNRPAVILTLITLGKLLEARAKGRTSAAIKQLIGLRPKTAAVLENGVEKSVPIEDVMPGHHPDRSSRGEKIPVDALVS